jgi:hypothetical protein
MKIVLFEDTPDTAERLVKALRNAMRKRGTAHHFSSANGHADGTYEARLLAELNKDPFRNASLIVADRDLSRTDGYRGLSEANVRRVADNLAIPQCFYTRNAGDDFLRAAERRESHIAVSLAKGESSCAKQLVAIASGFETLRTKLAKAQNTTTGQSAGRTLASVLGKPEYADKIGLYASGDRNRPGDLLDLANAVGPEQLNRLTCLFGYWLWDSVLHYPGVVLNSVATSSYLNIRTAEFSELGSVQELFKPAQYKGPFADAKEKLWWRGMLDDMVAKEQLPNGRDLARMRLNLDLPQSECCEEESIPAGYYCMLRKMPVSRKNSRPGLAWFPRGADLARVSRTRYEELGPWL